MLHLLLPNTHDYRTWNIKYTNMLTIQNKHRTNKFITINKKINNPVSSKKYDRYLHPLKNKHIFYPNFINSSTAKYNGKEITTL